MARRQTTAPDSTIDLASYLRSHGDEILREWEPAARKLPSAAGLDQPRLFNFLPRLLEGFAELLDASAAGRARELTRDKAERHALDRLEEGFDLPELLTELSLLRECILRLWPGASGATPSDREQRDVLNRAVDRASIVSVGKYLEARDRLLGALDRISSTALEARTLDELLQRLVTTFREEMPAVDTMTLLLREGDEIRVRAASGLEEEVSIGSSMRIGEGFAGTIARERRPHSVRAAHRDPLVESDAIRTTGVKALHGVPLIDGGELLGVVQMGSLTATEFSHEDRVMLESMASRATAGIYQHMLRHKAQARARELEESERRFEATFESATVGLAHVALDGTLLRFNEKYCSILGYTHDELMRLRFQDLSHPDDVQPDLDDMQRLVAGEINGYTIEKRYIRSDGSTVWVNLSVGLVGDGSGRPAYFVAAVQDITSHRLLRDRLAFLARASEILGSSLDLRKTLESAAELAVPGIADWCGVDLVEPGEALGDFVAVAHRDPAKVELVRELRRRYPPRRDAPAGPGKVLRTGEPDFFPESVEAMLRRIAVDETHRELLLSLGITSFLCVPLRRARDTIGALSLANTESGRRFTREDLYLAQDFAHRTSLAVENARLHEEVTRAVFLRDQVLGVVSHDLRNPIATISLAGDLLLRNRAIRDNTDVRRQIAVIQRSTARATRLITDLLDVSTIQSGKLALHLGSCEMASLLAESREAHGPLAKEKGITLRWRTRLNGTYVHCDRDRLLQVLGNLIGNALKFCREGDEVAVRAEVKAGMALVSVVDTGPGISPHAIERIFDVYWKGRRSESGVGLGLFIAKGIIESHGGGLWVESRLGDGSTFSFTVPLADAPPANEAA